MRLRFFFLLSFFLFTLFNYPQSRELDSVRTLLSNVRDDLSKLKHLEAMEYYHKQLQNIDSSVYFGEEAIRVATKLNAKTDLCDLYAGLGDKYQNKGKRPKALEYFLKALGLAEQMGDESRIADAHVCLGTLYDGGSDFKKALRNYYTALAVYKKRGIKDRISMVTGNIGNIYFSQRQFEKALEFYLEALTIDKELNSKANLKYSMGYTGMAYSQLAKKNKSKRDSLSLMARNYYRNALEMSWEMNDMRLVVNWLGNIGMSDYEMGNFVQAEKSLLRTLALADSMDLPDERIQFEEAISELYYEMKDYKKSIDHHRIYTREKDSMFTAEKERELARHEMDYKFEKKMATVKSEQEKKEAMAEARARQQRLIIVSVIAGLIILSAAFLIILKALRTTRIQKAIIEKQKQMVDEKQKEIIDSIYYARRIQQSLLATESYINRNLGRLLKK